jgi:predicted Zn finger-like uncharacterized protein
MIINITCPNCNFSKKVPREKIPRGLKYAKCPRCSSTFELPSADDPEEIEESDFNDVVNPGSGTDTLDEEGYFTGLWKTLRGILFSPTVFFRDLRKRSGIGDALAFGILLGSIGSMFGIFWQFLLDPKGITYIARLLPESLSRRYRTLTR